MTPELMTPSSFLGSKQRGRATRETFALFAQKEKKKHLSLANYTERWILYCLLRNYIRMRNDFGSLYSSSLLASVTLTSGEQSMTFHRDETLRQLRDKRIKTPTVARCIYHLPMTRIALAQIRMMISYD